MAVYPDDVLEDLQAVSDLSHIDDGDLAQMARPLDVLGINYYRRHHVRHRVRASASGHRAQWPGSPDIDVVEPPGPHTDGGWAVEPDGLVEVLEHLSTAYAGPPLEIHEAGAAYRDEVGPRGAVDDPQRVAWLQAHVEAAAEAVRRGVDLRAFHVWSLLDNFEWAEGYANRFGIVHVDFASGARTPKQSFHWYRDLVARSRP